MPSNKIIAPKENSGSHLATLTLSATYRPVSNVTQWRFGAGNTRGLLGPAIREIQCFSKELRCADCILQEGGCLYPLLLEGCSLPGGGAIVKPFVLHVPWDGGEASHRPPRETGFSMTLFGSAVVERLPHLVAALVRLGERGMGPRRIPLQLLRVEALAPDGAPYHRIWAADSRFSMPGQVAWPLEPVSSTSDTPDTIPWIDVRFLTPLKPKKEGKPIADGLSFQEVVRRILSRRHNLMLAFGSQSLSLHEMEERLRLQEAEALRLSRLVPDTKAQLPWVKGMRWSAREKKSQSLGGLLGTARFGPIPSPLLDLLRLGALIHMGNKTTEGLGAFSLLTDTGRWDPPFWSPQPPAAVDPMGTGF